MLSGLFIKGYSGWIALAHKTISVLLNYIERSFPNGTNRKKICRKCFDHLMKRLSYLLFFHFYFISGYLLSHAVATIGGDVIATITCLYPSRVCHALSVKWAGHAPY